MLSPKQSKPFLDAAHPVVRENARQVERFKSKCKAVGISQSEGIRQLVAGFLAHPTNLEPRTWGMDRTAHFPEAKNTRSNVDRLQRLAASKGLHQGEVIRQLIQKYLEQT